MELSPVLLSIKTSVASICFTFFLGIFAAHAVAGLKSERMKHLLDGILTLPLVLISFPLMYRSARGAFEQVDETVVQAARTLGIPEWTIFWKILLPLARPGILSGGVLAFARGLGEFGATAMIAGNIAGKTRTLPLAIYSEVAAGDMEGAGKYVAVIVAVSLLIVAGMNRAAEAERRRS